MAVKYHFTMSFKYFCIFQKKQHTVIARNTNNALRSCNANILVSCTQPEGDTWAENKISSLSSSVTALPYNWVLFSSRSHEEFPCPTHLWQ